MYCCLLSLLVNILLYTTTIIATPYFRPWLEIRQQPTFSATSNLVYPPNNDASTCPQNPTNLFQPGSALIATKPSKKRRRNIHNNFRVPVPNPRGQHAKRALVNGTCQTIATMGFEDWEQSYQANTPTVTLEGGHKYTFSIAANVEIKKLQCWTKKPNSGDFQRLSEYFPSDKIHVMNATLVTDLKAPAAVHWYIDFKYGHPRGNIAVFSDKPPALTADKQWSPDATKPISSKPKSKKKRKRKTKQWGW